MTTISEMTQQELIELIEKKDQRIEELEKKLSEQNRIIMQKDGSEDKYRLMVENLPSVVWSTSREGKTVFISHNVEDVYGYSSSEVYEKGEEVWINRIHPDDVDGVLQAFEALFAENKKYDIEYRIKKKDGKWIWLHDTASISQEIDGIQYANGVFTDVTDHKFAREALKEKTLELERSNQRLLVEIAEGKRQEQMIRKQTEEILNLSTPVIQLWKGIVVAPIVGTLDEQRTQQFTDRLLNTLVKTDSNTALIDITGVPTIDSHSAKHLIDTVNAAKLLGAKVMLTGIHPSIAQMLVHLGENLGDIDTRASLSDGLAAALGMLNDEPNRAGTDIDTTAYKKAAKHARKSANGK